MSARIADIGRAVRDAVNAAALPLPVAATFEWSPERAREDLADIEVVVVPASGAWANVARSRPEQELVVLVSVRAPLDPQDAAFEDRIEGLVELVEAVALAIHQKPMAGVSCRSVETVPLWDAADLRERSEFSGLLRATYRAFP